MKFWPALWFFILFACKGIAQTPTVTPLPYVWQVTLTTIDEKCSKGAAGIQLSPDTLSRIIQWSNGSTGVFSISDLSAGDYSLKLIRGAKDTTIYFTIARLVCPVVISNQFTPNDDGYNDNWQIGNVASYPNFEVFVFNKWGQQVHHQEKTFTPWDGTSFGVGVPDGAYYYVFYYDKGKKGDYLKGDISILR